MFDSLPSPQFAEDLLFFMLQLGRKETENRLTHNFICPIAEDALGRFIPRDDDSVEVLADDGIVEELTIAARWKRGSTVVFGTVPGVSGEGFIRGMFHGSPLQVIAC